jgi:AbrB family looped-hinge helix DNA binding protein
MKNMQLIAIKPVGAMGRVVIPADLRRLLGLHPGKHVGIYKSGDMLVLRPMGPRYTVETAELDGVPGTVRVHRRPSDD